MRRSGIDRARARAAIAAALTLALTAAVGADASSASLLPISINGPAAAGPPQPGTPQYFQRDNQNMSDAYGRQTAPDGQLSPDFVQAAPSDPGPYLQQVADQAANPTRPIIDPGQWFPGWNQGNPYRQHWSGKRGLEVPVAFTNRYGALLRGDVYAPLPHARDPYSHKRLKPPYPVVVITTGSVQGSEMMYRWLGQDLAERGYVAITYDVQGQGRSETFPHQGPAEDIPWCDPTSKPAPREQGGCPGVPFQQESNFIYGTQDAISFVESTPRHRYPNPHKGSANVNSFNPLWGLIDRRRDRRSVTPGRTNKLAIVGHSLGAAAISYVQGIDKRVETAVALDKLSASKNGNIQSEDVTPAVPSLGIQSEYGFNVQPYWAANNSSFAATPGDPSKRPDPQREEKTGFDAWRKAGVDTAVIVPRASTHLEYTDINWALPASRYGQDVASWYTQAWIDKYLKHDPSADRRMLATRFTYLEPRPHDVWSPVTLDIPSHLSFYFCSGFAFHSASRRLVASSDIAGVGGC